MFTSLKVVSMAAVCCAATRRSATRLRSRDIGSRRVSPCGTTGAADAAGSGALGFCSGAGSLTAAGMTERCRRRLRGLFGRRGRSGTLPGLDHRHHFVGLDHGALGLTQLDQDAGCRRGNFQDHLVGFQVDQGFVARDHLADLLAPRQQGAAGHRIGQRRHAHFNFHRGSPARRSAALPVPRGGATGSPTPARRRLGGRRNGSACRPVRNG